MTNLVSMEEKLSILSDKTSKDIIPQKVELLFIFPILTTLNGACEFGYLFP